MKRHLNKLFVRTQGSYLARDGEAVLIRVGEEKRMRVPVINIGGIVCFGQVSMSPPLMGLCAESGVTVSFLTENGRFLANVVGYAPGNVLLRRAQYRGADDLERCGNIVQNIVSAKIANSRAVMLRAVRDHPTSPGRKELEAGSARLAQYSKQARTAKTSDQARGIEGESASVYFGLFNYFLTAQREDFAFTVRSRRPPLDNINALLSFLYTLLAHDARSACEASGLDAGVGFLHRDRPGRPGLALDLMEEFRAYLADRLAVSLINRQQLRASGFRATESGGVLMDDETRKIVITAYQERKQEAVMHPFIGEKTTIGLLLHLQARIMARHLRGDIDAYVPFLIR